MSAPSEQGGQGVARHTPGPWLCEIKETCCVIRHTRPPCDGYANRIAETMQWSPAEGGRVSAPESHANARLIAAAPDLLAAAERMVAATEADQHFIGEEHEALKAAIAKARGEAA